MNIRQQFDEIIKKQQDLVRDFQYCLKNSQDDKWKDFFGAMAQEQAMLAHQCLEKSRKI